MKTELEDALFHCERFSALARCEGARRLPFVLVEQVSECVARQPELRGEFPVALKHIALSVAQQTAMMEFCVDVRQIGLERFRQDAQRALEALAVALVELRGGVEYAEDEIDAGIDPVETFVEVAQP